MEITNIQRYQDSIPEPLPPQEELETKALVSQLFSHLQSQGLDTRNIRAVAYRYNADGQPVLIVTLLNGVQRSYSEELDPQSQQLICAILGPFQPPPPLPPLFSFLQPDTAPPPPAPTAPRRPADPLRRRLRKMEREIEALRQQPLPDFGPQLQALQRQIEALRRNQQEWAQLYREEARRRPAEVADAVHEELARYQHALRAALAHLDQHIGAIDQRNRAEIEALREEFQRSARDVAAELERLRARPAPPDAEQDQLAERLATLDERIERLQRALEERPAPRPPEAPRAAAAEEAVPHAQLAALEAGLERLSEAQMQIRQELQAHRAPAAEPLLEERLRQHIEMSLERLQREIAASNERARGDMERRIREGQELERQRARREDVAPRPQEAPRGAELAAAAALGAGLAELRQALQQQTTAAQAAQNAAAQQLRELQETLERALARQHEELTGQLQADRQQLGQLAQALGLLQRQQNGSAESLQRMGEAQRAETERLLQEQERRFRAQAEQIAQQVRSLEQQLALARQARAAASMPRPHNMLLIPRGRRRPATPADVLIGGPAGPRVPRRAWSLHDQNLLRNFRLPGLPSGLPFSHTGAQVPQPASPPAPLRPQEPPRPSLVADFLRHFGAEFDPAGQEF